MPVESAYRTKAVQNHLIVFCLVVGYRLVRSTPNHDFTAVALFIGALPSSVVAWSYFAFFPSVRRVDEVEGIS